MREIHSSLFKHRAIGQHSATAATPFGTLPLINNKVSTAVLLGQAGTDFLLQFEKIVPNGVNLHGTAC